MTEYTVEIPEGPERGIRVACTEHGETAEFQPGYTTVDFCCEACGNEVGIELRDLLEWRDLRELC